MEETRKAQRFQISVFIGGSISSVCNENGMTLLLGQRVARLRPALSHDAVLC